MGPGDCHLPCPRTVVCSDTAMSFSLKRKESVAHGWHRLVDQEFDAAESSIRALKKPERRAEEVHGARKHLKRLRALYQFSSEPLGRELCAKETSFLRDVARNLSAVRDVEVKGSTLEMITRESKLSRSASIEKLQQSWARRRDRLATMAARPGTISVLVSSLSAARRRFDLLPIPEGDWHLVSHALSRSYRRARKGFLAASDPLQNEEALHEWRKRVKALEYQLGVLKKVHRSVAAMSDKLHRLTEILGDEHDLFVLKASLAESEVGFVKTTTCKRVLATIETRRSKLRNRALKLGEAVFQEKTRQFLERLHERWREWR